jgi:ribose transport system ATP-binding protein/rhamnose transport system ATP-binding protein
MARNTALLEAVSADYFGAAFWALIDGDGLICLNLVEAAGSSSPGLRTGEAMRIAQTQIPRALTERQDGFVAEADVPLSTLLVPMRSPRGHDFGWIGLTVDSRMPIPSAQVIRNRVESLMSTD